MKIVQITAGAGGRLCGSCLHDNALVRALRQRNRDAMLVPAYVPTTSDEENVAEPIVVMGGVNVFLQQNSSFFRHTPRWIDWFFDRPFLLRALSRWSGNARPADLGPLTASSLRGEEGCQRKEVSRLAAWLARDIRPDVVHLSNVLLLGLAKPIRRATGASIVVTLSGEDLFISQLPEPYQREVRELLVERAADVDRFIALNSSYADRMQKILYCGQDRVTVIPHGIDPDGFPKKSPDLMARRASRGDRRVIGYLARACPEKGLDQVIRATALLVEKGMDVELVAAGATIPAEEEYLSGCHRLAEELRVSRRFHWQGQVDRNSKMKLLNEIDVFVMPTPVPEAKGIPVIEAMASGVPVVASASGAFPELLGIQEPMPAGEVHIPGDIPDLTRCIEKVLRDETFAAELGLAGHTRVTQRYQSHHMAAAHESLYEDMQT
ncbi:MAG: glycosyltransferase family 4 protein [Planctomycetaceae bacterium]|nr:glycosyltransferase family 4 protein [Planctomycetaceae bacterium]MBT6919189.1 glycosyltransferase family 4 protein [Planctomycetaceae bacterium]